MYEATYEFAEIPVRIRTFHKFTHEKCIEYKTEKAPCEEITVTEEDIAYEKALSEKVFNTERNYSDAYSELLAVLRKFTQRAIEHNTALLHGSAIAYDGSGIIFTARSGTGKSTHREYWKKCFGERVRTINDDKPLLKKKDGKIYVWGTPWNGKHNLSENACVELKAVVLLSRAENNHIEQIPFEEAFGELYKHFYKSSNGEYIGKLLEFCNEMSKSVKCFRLGCNMSNEAAKTAYKGMKDVL